MDSQRTPEKCIMNATADRAPVFMKALCVLDPLLQIRLHTFMLVWTSSSIFLSVYVFLFLSVLNCMNFDLFISLFVIFYSQVASGIRCSFNLIGTMFQQSKFRSGVLLFLSPQYFFCSCLSFVCLSLLIFSS
jgi:hypothetical protein